MTDFDAMARRTDPDTSHIAAVTVDTNRLEGYVLSILGQYSLPHNPDGLTVREISTLLHIDMVSISPRMKPLEKKGLVERTTKRRGRSIVWRSL